MRPLLLSSLRGCAVAAALLLTMTAAAQPAPTNEAADVLFREGKALLDAGRLEEACRVLEESNRLEAAGGTLLNLASCYERRGRYASAERALSEAARLAEAAGREDAINFIKGRLAAVAPNVSVIRLKLDDRRSVQATLVEVDKSGVEVSGATIELRLDPGSHDVRVETEGMAVWRKTISLEGEGKVVDVAVEAPPPSAPAAIVTPPTAEPADDGMHRTFEIVGIVGLGVGGSLLIGGAIAGGLAIGAWSDATELCPNPQCDNATGVLRAQDAETYGNVSTGLFVAGGVLAAAGIVFVVLANVEPSTTKAGWVAPNRIRF